MSNESSDKRLVYRPVRMCFLERGSGTKIIACSNMHSDFVDTLDRDDLEEGLREEVLVTLETLPRRQLTMVKRTERIIG